MNNDLLIVNESLSKSNFISSCMHMHIFIFPFISFISFSFKKYIIFSIQSYNDDNNKIKTIQIVCRLEKKIIKLKIKIRKYNRNEKIMFSCRFATFFFFKKINNKISVIYNSYNLDNDQFK